MSFVPPSPLLPQDCPFHKIKVHKSVSAALPIDLLLGPICPWRTVTTENNCEGNNRLQTTFETTKCEEMTGKDWATSAKNKGQGIRLESVKKIWGHFTLRDAWMSKKGLFRTLKGSLVLSICPSFIFSIRGEIISFSMHTSRILKSHCPTGWPYKQQKQKKKTIIKLYYSPIKQAHSPTISYRHKTTLFQISAYLVMSCEFTETCNNLLVLNSPKIVCLWFLCAIVKCEVNAECSSEAVNLHVFINL